MTGLRQTLAIARREIAAFFVAPIAPVVAALFLAVEGFSFFAVLRVLSDPRRPAPYGAVLRTHFGGTFLYWSFLFFVVAVLTMRLIAEERRRGTWEVLRTAPVSAAAIVGGKWLGALVTYLALWLPTLAYVGILAWLAPPGAEPDPGPIASAYLGVAVTGASALAIGVLASALTGNQVVAAALTFVLLLGILLAGVLADIAPDLAPPLAALDVRRHMDDFARGIIDVRHLALHAGLAFAALVASAAVISVERRPRELPAAALAVALAAAAAVLLGVIAARHPVRLDATRARVYTLDDQTRRILADVDQPVEITVIGAGRPEFAELYDEVREVARRFAAASRHISVATADPTVDPGRIGELAEELALSPDEVSGGGAVVVASAGRRRAVALLDMATFGPSEVGGKLASFRGEEALAAAVLEVSDPARPPICFSQGHGELDLDEDLSRVTEALARGGFGARALASLQVVPASCAALAVVGPRRPLDRDEVVAVEQYLRGGGRILVAAADPVGLDETLGVNLGAEVAGGGAQLAPGVWATLDGYGSHPVSAAFRGRRLTVWHQPRRVLGVGATPLVLSAAGDAIGVATEDPRTGARAVVFGTARSFATGELERSGGANDALIASAIAWLTGRTKLVGIGPKTPEQLRIALTAADERRVFWIAVVLLPAAAALAGLLLAWRRRRTG